MRARSAAIVLAALAWTGLALQLALSMSAGRGALHGLAMYLGYFTILSNLLLAIIATAAARRSDGGIDLDWRGCAVTSIVLVGLVYHLLLREAWGSLGGLQWLANALLHYIAPVAGLAWWLGWPPRKRIAAAMPLRWLAWPALYAAYALTRGALTGFYPYPFIDVPALGMARVLLNCVGVGVAFLVLAYILRAVTQWRMRAAAQAS